MSCQNMWCRFVEGGSEDAFACEEVTPELGRGVDSGPPAPADVGEADVLGTCGLEEAEDMDEELRGQVVYADDHPYITDRWTRPWP